MTIQQDQTEMDIQKLLHLGKLLHNPTLIKFVTFLIENDNQKFSLTKISKKTKISKQYISTICKILADYGEFLPSRNFDSERGFIIIPQLNPKFKTFFITLLKMWKDVIDDET